MAKLDERSDAELLRQSSRSADAFGVFYDRHVEAIFRYFGRRTSDTSLAADLTAETFAQAYASRRRFRDKSTPATGWLFTIARRQLNEFFRQERVARTYRDKLQIPDSTAGDFERIDDLDELVRLAPKAAEALNSLSEKSREALELRVGHGWSYERLAAHIGGTPAAARVRTSRALAAVIDACETYPTSNNPRR